MEWVLSEMTASLLFWIVSCGLAAWGAVGVAHAAWLGRRATESVVGLAEETDSDGGTLYRAVVAFTAGCADHRVVDPMASRPAAHRVGDRVRVFYPPGRPDQAQLGRWRYAWPFLWAGAAGWGSLTVGLVWRLG